MAAIWDLFQEELRAIKSAKFTFLVGFVVLSVMIWYAEDSWVFRPRLADKDAIIKDKNELIEDLSNRLDDARKQAVGASGSGQVPIAKQNSPPRTLGSATTQGDESPANTGNGNSFSYGDPAKTKGTQK
jgi:hypothetical protein